MGVTCSLRLRLFPIGDLIHERKNPLSGYLFQILTAEFFKKLGKNQIVRID